jgi:flagellar L-ring protein precursor FlgH
LLRVSGVVRPYDIDITNNVSSAVIADFLMKYEGGGVESRFMNQGWLGKTVNKVWPF